ncbi:MAG: hypothetical protein U5R31_01510 [Acidimicrobiia bacterium]|nr:hypothetical protein [Acidimicrobiia bacterium]
MPDRAGEPSGGPDRPSFAERRARAAELRKGDYEALRSGRPPLILVAALAVVVLTLCVPLFALLAVLEVWLFGWTVWVVTAVVWVLALGGLAVAVRRTTPRG